jgi:hypothetical protein
VHQKENAHVRHDLLRKDVAKHKDEMLATAEMNVEHMEPNTDQIPLAMNDERKGIQYYNMGEVNGSFKKIGRRKRNYEDL